MKLIKINVCVCVCVLVVVCVLWCVVLLYSVNIRVKNRNEGGVQDEENDKNNGIYSYYEEIYLYYISFTNKDCVRLYVCGWMDVQ